MEGATRYVFIYYKVHERDSDTLRAAVHEMAERLREQVPGLGVSLMRRPESLDGTQTWMEAYERAEGIGADVLARIEDAARGLPRVLIGARRVEAFEPLSGSAPGGR